MLYFPNRVQHCYIVVFISIEQLQYLLHLYKESHISAVAFDSALRVINLPTKELTFLLQLYDQGHIGGTALDYALRVLTSEMLQYLIPIGV